MKYLKPLVEFLIPILWAVIFNSFALMGIVIFPAFLDCVIKVTDYYSTSAPYLAEAIKVLPTEYLLGCITFLFLGFLKILNIKLPFTKQQTVKEMQTP